MDSSFCLFLKAFLSIEDDTDQPEESVFYQVQSLFGHLMESKLQYYVPENFWKVTDPLPCVVTTHLLRRLLIKFSISTLV